MSDTQMEIWDALSCLSGEEVERLLTDWHGLQLFDRGFYEFLVQEGVLYDE